MLSKNEFKHLMSLNMKKFRNAEKKFFVEGAKQVLEGLQSAWTCELIIVTESFEANNKVILDEIKQREVRIEKIKESDFYKLSDTNKPQGILAVFNQKDFNLRDIQPGYPVVLLENISDPGNLGTILRTCDWFGIKMIILSKDCADLYNSKVIRSTMGSIFHLNLYRPENYLEGVKELQLKGYKIVTADLKGISYKSFEYVQSVVIVLSSESHGPSNEIVQISDSIITIDKYGEAESLNVASAAAVLLSEVARNLNPN